MNAPAPTQLRSILCPVDLSEFSAPALAHAVSLARFFGGEVTALHVLPSGGLTSPQGASLESDARASILEELHTVAAPLASPGVPVRIETAEGGIAAAIVDYASDHATDLIVLGTHGLSGFDRLALGSVAEKVIRKAPCPVMTLPPGMVRTASAIAFHEILCPTDFSSYSDQALDFAASLAARTEGRVTALHVVETFDSRPEVSASGAMTELRKRQCDTELRALTESTAVRAAGVRTDNVVVLGRPYLEILKTADALAANVIVIGVRGRSAVDMTLLGSTTNQVVRKAKCPVVTIRS